MLIVNIILQISTCNTTDDTLLQLSQGPSCNVISYKGYMINGMRFHKKMAEKSTQNSGVYLESHGKGQWKEKEEYFGIIKDIIVLDYRTFKVPLFWCDWADNRTGVKKLEFYTLLKFTVSQAQSTMDPFILCSQAKQAFYARENDTSNWFIALKASNKGCFEQDADEEF